MPEARGYHTTMTNHTNNPKRNHHFVPRLYLKGFVIKKDEPYIWVYKRGEPYNPGLHKTKNNPCKRSIRNAGMERDYYADPKEGGEKDFESFENIFELLEKPADPVFEKIRSHQTINDEEKLIFSRYIVLMHKRVPRFRHKVGELLPQTVASFGASKELLEKIHRPDSEQTRAYLKNILVRVAQQPGLDIRTHLRIIAAASKSVLVEVLYNMSWQFLVAPEGHWFLAGDDPVYFSKACGLDKNVSEISLPIARDVALVASWRKEQKGGFTKAPPQVVKELNRRTASQASKRLYFSQDSNWVVSLFRKTHHEFRPLYKVKSVYQVVKIERAVSPSFPS